MIMLIDSNPTTRRPTPMNQDCLIFERAKCKKTLGVWVSSKLTTMLSIGFYDWQIYSKRNMHKTI